MNLTIQALKANPGCNTTTNSISCQSPKQIFFGNNEEKTFLDAKKFIMTRLKSLQKNTHPNIVDKYYSAEDKNIQEFGECISQETLPFMQNLAGKITSLDLHLQDAIVIAKNYVKNYPNRNSRTLMERSLAKHDTIFLGAKGLFGKAYDGSSAQNEIIDFMNVLKDRDFAGTDYYSLEQSVTPENVGFAKRLLTQRIPDKTPKTVLNPQQTLEIISKESDPKIIKLRLKLEAQKSATVNQMPLLIRDLNYIGYPLSKYSTDMKPLLEDLLPRFENVDQLNTFMSAYKPSLEPTYKNGISAIKENVLSMQDFTDALAISH